MFLPAAEHFARFRQKLRDGNVFFIVQSLYFPNQAHEKFQRIQFYARFLKIFYFLGRGSVAGLKDYFKKVQEQIVNFLAESVARRPRKIRKDNLPKFVGFDDFRKNWQAFKKPFRRGGLEDGNL